MGVMRMASWVVVSLSLAFGTVRRLSQDRQNDTFEGLLRTGSYAAEKRRFRRVQSARKRVSTDKMAMVDKKAGKVEGLEKNRRSCFGGKKTKS